MKKKMLKYSAIGLVAFLLLNLGLQAEQIHHDYIRASVGSQVVRIWKEGKEGGGTGFHVQAPSGKVYIMTNAHVCDYANDAGMVLVQDGEDPTLTYRSIIESSDKTDLCLVEPLLGKSGLKLGSEPEIGDLIEVVGHPKLMPLVVTSGEIFAQEVIQVMDHVIEGNDPDDCKKPKNKKIEDVPFLFWTVDICVIEIEAYNSTAVIQGGSSGSPVVDYAGRVIAVAFAGGNATYWGSFVTYEQVKEFLSNY